MSAKPNYTCRTAFLTLQKKNLENLGITTDFSKLDEIQNSLEDVAGDGCNIAGSFCTSANGLEHIHLAVSYPDSRKIGGIAKEWGKAHTEPQRGTKEDVEAYCRKTGKFEEKGEIVHKVFGSFDTMGNKAGHRTDLDIKTKLLLERKKKDFNLNEWLVENIPADRTSLWDYCRKIHNALLITEIPPERNVKVIYVQGNSGQGKTYPIQKHIRNVFTVNMDNATFPWDGYEGEKTVLFDELRPNQVPNPQKLFQWLDKYRCPINIKNGKSMINATLIFITSAFSFEEWYKDGEKIKNVESIEQIRTQFRRRIDIVYTAEKHKWKRQGNPKDEFEKIQNGELEPANSKYFKHLSKGNNNIKLVV